MTGKRLFVGGLAWDLTDDDLREAFGLYGTVKDARVVMERGTDRSRGFGFVEFETAEQAVAALVLNGTKLGGRALRVNPAEGTGPIAPVQAPVPEVVKLRRPLGWNREDPGGEKPPKRRM